MNEDKTLPYNEEAEKSYVSNCLQHEDSLDAALEQGADRWLFHLPCKSILEACFALRNAGEPIDVTTVGAKLIESGFVEKFGVEHLMDVYTTSTTNAHQGHYGKLIRADWTKRECIAILEGGTEKAYSDSCIASELINELETEILAVRESCEAKDGALMSVKDVMMKTLDSIEKAQARGGGIAGVPTGICKLDEMISGFQPGNLILIPARPSTGKTAMLVTMIHDLLEINEPVGLFTLEMSASEIMRRFYALHCNIPYTKLLEGRLSESDLGNLMRYSGEIAGMKFIIDDTPSLTLNQFRSRCRRLARMGIRLIGIDYIQLMRAHTKRASENRQVEVSDIAEGVKGVLKECKMTGLILCQLNRDADKTVRKPRMSDIRESGALEQVADVIGAIYRPNKDNEDYAEENVEPCSFELLKNRNGATGTIPMNFFKQSMRFRERTTI